MSDASAAFFQAIEARLDRFDLLQHPYYQAWSKGELTRVDLREYAAEYWHHVSAFPAPLPPAGRQVAPGSAGEPGR